MQFATHFSPEAVDLLMKNHIELDRFKIPAWPTLIPQVTIRPPYIHFPLCVGRGNLLFGKLGWYDIDTLLTKTDTPFLNVHLAVPKSEFENPDQLYETTMRDLETVIRRYGADKVIAENDHDSLGRYPPAVFDPTFISRVIEESGCGLLLDVSHARLAAHYLDMAVQDYLALLPVQRIRELHVTGIQFFDDTWFTHLAQRGVPSENLTMMQGRLVDHLPMVAEDWTFFEWVLAQIRSGAWAEPWVIAYEVSGIGMPWEALNDPDRMCEELPRFYQLINSH